MNLRRNFAPIAKTLAVAVMLNVVALVVAVPRGHADDRANCQRRIEKTEAKFHEEVRKHGWNSRQADNRRAQLNAERERCWNQHRGWWGFQDHQWHNDRDWDRYDRERYERDHDRDRDRDRDRDDRDRDHDRDRR